MRSLWTRRTKRAERGAVAVEFALVVPILLLVLIGIINFGVVITQQLSLSNAARQAARYSVIDGRDCDMVEAEARAAVATVGMGADAPVFTITGGTCPEPCADSTVGANVNVTMTYESTYVVPFPIPGFDNSIDLEGEGQFRCEFS